MDTVWEIIAPWAATIGGAGGAGVIIYAVLRALVGKVLSKNNAMLDSTYNVNNLAQKVAERLGGKTLNIDVTAVTERALKKLAKELDVKITKVETATNSLKAILAAMGKGIIKLKALTEEEITGLASAIKSLEEGYASPITEEPMTVLLQPVEVIKEPEEPAHGRLNFTGLGSDNEKD